MILNEVIIRQDICRKQCKSQCQEYLDGKIDHANPCVGCPLKIWNAFEEEGCPRAPDPDVEFLTSASRTANQIAPPDTGPGSVLKKVIFQITGIEPKNCGCNKRAAVMNEWGWTGCWTHREQIVNWLLEEVKARGHEVGRSSILSLLAAAWRESKNKSNGNDAHSQ